MILWKKEAGCVGNSVSPSSHSALPLPSDLYSSPFERSHIDPGEQNPAAECIKEGNSLVLVWVAGPVKVDGAAERDKIKRDKKKKLSGEKNEERRLWQSAKNEPSE